MFLNLKKHPQPEWTPADEKRERLLRIYFAAETNLEEQAKAAIVCKGVIDLYPDGPDKERAIKDFEAAQHSLLCAISTVDSLRKAMRDYIAAHEKDFEATAQWAVPSANISSHTIIEKVYRDFFAARQ